MVATALEPLPVCPSCGRRDAEASSSTGWCAECIVARVAERYSLADRERVADSIASWVERTEPVRIDARAVTLRQQRSRLMRKMRPTEPVPSGVDPLALGAEALEILTRMRFAFGRFPEERRRLEELIQRLSWGPLD